MRKATHYRRPSESVRFISIHALREEGDPCLRGCSQPSHIFLSTPSARRATGWLLGRPVSSRISIHALREEGDLPSLRRFLWFSISIHALREEGDSFASVKSPVFSSFLSTPSARRATVSHNDPDYLLRISIHALREEGDADLPPDHDHRTISIHALREEGDLSLSEARDQVRLISIHALREEGDSYFLRSSSI